MQQFPSSRRVRALFVSDVHLGMRDTRIEPLLVLLSSLDAETIYLVGDIVDGWQLKKSWHWPAAYNRLVQVLLDKSRRGARIVYIPGNHDAFLRDFLGASFGGVEIQDWAVHDAANGRRYLVIHGDQFDGMVRHARWRAWLGDRLYNIALSLVAAVNAMRRRHGLEQWSLSAWARANVRRAAEFVQRFENAASADAMRRGLDGVICGHVHCPANTLRGGVHYLNTGDWVENATAIVEHDDGRFELIEWRAFHSPERIGVMEGVQG